MADLLREFCVTMMNLRTTPHKYRGKLFLVDENNYRAAAAAIGKQEYPIVSLNETGEGDFTQIKSEINRALARLFPKKSAFEI